MFAVMANAVAAADAPRGMHFANDIVPVLSRFGCNASGCHGKAEGQNGFKLSVFGFDPAADYIALTQESRGRRVLPASGGRGWTEGKPRSTATSLRFRGFAKPLQPGHPPPQPKLVKHVPHNGLVTVVVSRLPHLWQCFSR